MLFIYYVCLIVDLVALMLTVVKYNDHEYFYLIIAVGILSTAFILTIIDDAKS